MLITDSFFKCPCNLGTFIVRTLFPVPHVWRRFLTSSHRHIIIVADFTFANVSLQHNLSSPVRAAYLDPCTMLHVDPYFSDIRCTSFLATLLTLCHMLVTESTHSNLVATDVMALFFALCFILHVDSSFFFLVSTSIEVVF